MKLRVGCGVLVVGIAMMMSGAVRAQSSRIVFATDRTTPGDLDIWKMRETGEYPVELTDESESVHGLTLSPRGQKVLYDNRVEDGPENVISADLFLVSSGGGTPVNLTGSGTAACNEDANDLCYNPDAGPVVNIAGDFRIVFSRKYTKPIQGYNPDPVVTEIWMATVDVSESALVPTSFRSLTDIVPQELAQVDPAWCGNDRVVWARPASSAPFPTGLYPREICIMEVDEDGPTGAPVCYWDDEGMAEKRDDTQPSCNSDGSQLAWSRSNPDYAGTRDIWVMNCDGLVCDDENASNLMHEDEHEVDDFHPVWSPGGTQIAFVSDRAKMNDQDDIDLDIYFMNAEDGENKQNITDAYVRQDTEPDWGGSSLGN